MFRKVLGREQQIKTMRLWHNNRWRGKADGATSREWGDWLLLMGCSLSPFTWFTAFILLFCLGAWRQWSFLARVHACSANWWTGETDTFCSLTTSSMVTATGCKWRISRTFKRIPLRTASMSTRREASVSAPSVPDSNWGSFGCWRGGILEVTKLDPKAHRVANGLDCKYFVRGQQDIHYSLKWRK